MSEIKFCKDCKHYSPMFAYCHRKVNESVSIVTGMKDYRLSLDAFKEREVPGHVNGYCGINGKLYEPKPVKLSLWKRFINGWNTTFRGYP